MKLETRSTRKSKADLPWDRGQATGAPEDAGKGKPILESGDRAFTTDGMGVTEVGRGPWSTLVQPPCSKQGQQKEIVTSCYLTMQINGTSDKLQEYSSAVLARFPNKPVQWQLCCPNATLNINFFPRSVYNVHVIDQCRLSPLMTLHPLHLCLSSRTERNSCLKAFGNHKNTLFWSHGCCVWASLGKNWFTLKFESGLTGCVQWKITGTRKDLLLFYACVVSTLGMEGSYTELPGITGYQIMTLGKSPSSFPKN